MGTITPPIPPQPNFVKSGFAGIVTCFFKNVEWNYRSFVNMMHLEIG